MLKASQKYLEELKATQKKVEAINILSETQDGESSSVLESHTSELNIEFGPLKMNVKKSKTLTRNNAFVKSETHSFDKRALLEKNSNRTNTQEQTLNQGVNSPSTHQLRRRVNIVV